MLRTNWLVIIAISLSCNAQTDSVKYKFPGYKYGCDTIINCQQLGNFFSKLKSLTYTEKDSTVNILHIGDSHIQADFLTREIRNLLQKKFGNAGRGLIFPYRQANSNESSDYRSSSNSNWKWVTVRNHGRSFEPGIAGTTISSKDDIFSISIKVNNKDSVDNSFIKFQLICRNDTSGLIAIAENTECNERNLLAFSNETSYETEFRKRLNQITLQSYGNLLIDGMVLKSGKGGILYHVIGTNGAHYSDYNQSPVFFKEMTELKPDLVIISLGTNEGVNSKITVESVKSEVEKMLLNLRTSGINAPILIITPFDNYYRRKKFNKYLTTVRDGLVEACKKHNISCLDMYEITGGYKSASVWLSEGLITSDRVHYTAQGYKLQGKMIYNALINSFSKYAAN